LGLRQNKIFFGESNTKHATLETNFSGKKKKQKNLNPRIEAMFEF